ncbi:hypothetical protein GW17_00043981 [Ensete ventricosum]|nr:hypothetical protein GW17_00043981 [Ensete ventricosum]
MHCAYRPVPIPYRYQDKLDTLVQTNDEPRSSLGIGPGSDDTVGHRREFARRFAKGIGKLARNTLGDRRKKTGRLTARMSEAARLVGVLSAVDPPRPTVEPLVPRFYGYV